MSKIMLVSIIAIIALPARHAHADNYYLSAGGSNSFNGRSAENAWASPTMLSGVNIAGGDTVYILSGDTLQTSSAIPLHSTNTTQGNEQSPIVVSSYPPNGPAATILISSNSSKGIDIYNTGNIAVQNLKLVGPGALQSNEPGISVFADVPGNVKYPNITIDKCEVSGFFKGICIGAWPGDGSNSGFENVRITNCVTHTNRREGIETYGSWPSGENSRNHRNVYVAHCVSHTNKGDPGHTTNHSGSGIVLGNVSAGTIEYCRAYNNGELNGSNQGNGPVGIWVWESDSIVMQYNIAHDNKSGNTKDGGGFDIDGGANNCVIQYNYSYNNNGAGYLICQFSGASSFKNNVVRYNISENDGVNGMGGIHFWSSGSNGGIQNTQVYGNTVYTGVASAINFASGGVSGTIVSNNIFITDNRPLVQGAPSTAIAHFKNNCYWARSGTISIAGHSSLAAWRAGTGQERHDNADAGIYANPLLTNPGNGEALTDPQQLATLSAYRLLQNSPCIHAGLNLGQVYGIDMGGTDYYGTAIPQNTAYDIGAHEWEQATALRFTGDYPALSGLAACSGNPVHVYTLSGRKAGVFHSRKDIGYGSGLDGLIRGNGMVLLQSKQQQARGVHASKVIRTIK